MMMTKETEPVDYANSTLSFPHKLFILLEMDSNENNLIHWASHGMCFRIDDPEKFAEEVVPKYFKQTKLTSFQRQLNLYGFRRLSKGEDQGCYFHPKFQRNRKDLLTDIKRLPEKGSLQTYEQVMAAVHSLPSERFGTKRKQPSVNNLAIKEEPAPKKQLIEPSAASIAASNGIASSSAPPITLASVPANSSSAFQEMMNNSQSMYPRMSKLSMNIGFAKFMENQQKWVAGNRQQHFPAPPRPEHLLRSQVTQSTPQNPQQLYQLPQSQLQWQQPSNPSHSSFMEEQQELFHFPVMSNFASERDMNVHEKGMNEKDLNNEECAITNYDLELLDFLDPMNVDMDCDYLDCNAQRLTQNNHNNNKNLNNNHHHQNNNYDCRSSSNEEEYVPTFEEAIDLNRLL